MAQIDVLNVAFTNECDILQETFTDWTEAYEYRDYQQARSLLLGYDLNDVRFAVSVR